jgi:hypothetical protein
VAGEIIRDGETGRIVIPRDVSMLVETLVWARHHYDRMRVMAERVQKEALALRPRAQEEYFEAYRQGIDKI